MRTVEIEVYSFGELSEKAKDVARNKWREHSDYPWWDDAKSSIDAFCAHFGVTRKDYEVSTHRPYYFRTDADNAHFRGKQLKQYTPDGPVNAKTSGYCLDFALWGTFYNTFKQTGNAKYAFNEALDAAFKDVVSDMEWHESDEAIDETLTINEYEYTADGRQH
jgi:hypothetical protein